MIATEHLSSASATHTPDKHRRERERRNSAAWRARNPDLAKEAARRYREKHPAKTAEAQRKRRERERVRRAKILAKVTAKQIRDAKAKAKCKPMPTPSPAVEITANAKESGGKWQADREPWIVTHMRTLGPSTHDKKNLK